MPVSEFYENRPLLKGIRVLELGHFVAAPFCTRLLADLGADIIKIEPRSGDPVRQWGEMIDGKSLWWSMHGRNKRCITVDLKSPQGRELVLDLVEKCDVLVENFRPGKLEQLELGVGALRTRNPGLVVSHISGYGQDGPYRDRAAFGLIGEAIGGLRYLTNHPVGTTELPPVRVGVSIGDSIAGLYAAFGIVAALWSRDQAGDGQKVGRTVDVALTESILSMMEGMLPEYGALGKIKQPMGGAIPTAAPTNAYPSKDNSWVLIGANSEPLFEELAKLMDRADLVGAKGFDSNHARVKNMVVLDEIIAEWTRRYDVVELIEMLQNVNIPSCKIYTAEDCATDLQYRERRMVREIADPRFHQSILHAGVVPHIPESPGEIKWPGPDIGQHNEEVLTELLGKSRDEYDQLVAQGVV
jgi:crotonobetainyl-CoA:carnitine CoA-transferase CaiB-like acyl-CoA transferase